METGLRVVLLLVAILIVAGIVWDTFRSRRKPAIKKTRSYKIDRLDSKGYPEKKKKLTEEDPLQFELELDPEPDFSADDEVMIVNQSKTPAKTKLLDVEKHEEDEIEREILRAEPAPKTAKQEIIDTGKIFIINVMAKQPGVFLGKKLMSAFDDAHLFFGEMNIFHRYENTDGSGNLMFSLASAVEPGIFELAKLESFVTPGLTLFFSSTTRNQSIAAFEMMLRTARMLATVLDGELRDGNRRPLTLEGIEKYRESVRESVKLHKASFSSKR